MNPCCPGFECASAGRLEPNTCHEVPDRGFLEEPELVDYIEIPDPGIQEPETINDIPAKENGMVTEGTMVIDDIEIPEDPEHIEGGDSDSEIQEPELIDGTEILEEPELIEETPSTNSGGTQCGPDTTCPPGTRCLHVKYPFGLYTCLSN